MSTTQVGPLHTGRQSAAARLDRLPIGNFHKQLMFLVAYIFFFELGDLNTFAFAAPAIRASWHLSIATIGFVTSGSFIGMFIGATLAGRLSDRIGRRKALILTTCIYSGFSLLDAFAWNTTILFLTRTLTGTGLSAMTVVGITYIAEMFPASRRGAYQGWIMCIGLFGIPVTAHVALWVVPIASWGWRLIFVWGSLGMLMLPFTKNLLEESPRWYENHGRFAEADAVINRIETRIKKQYGELPPVPDVAPPVPRRGSFAEVFAPAVRSRTFILLGAWIGQTLGFYGFMAWVPTLLAAHGFSVVKSLAWTSTMHFGAPLGGIIAAMISDRWERKYLITAVALIIALFGLLYGTTFQTLTIIIFGFLVSMSIQVFAPLLYAYTPECYPTEIRNSGSGLGYGVGRLANVFGPLIVAFLFKSYGYLSVFVYIAITWTIVAIIVGFFGPKTKGRALV